MVVVGTGTIGSKFLKTKYPVDDGKTAGTTKLPDEMNQVPQEDLIYDKEKLGTGVN